MQSSIRAELRAIVHVARTARRPTTIRSDCKFVVDSFNRLQSGGKVQEEWPDKDLWLVLQAVLEARPPAFLMVSWMPAHLDEDKNKAKRWMAKTCGLVSDADIYGNCQADELAKRGKDMRKVADNISWGFKDRKHITVRTQEYLLQVWQHFEAEVKASACQGTDIDQILAQDEDAFEQLALEEHQRATVQSYDEDIDVFGLVDLDGEEIGQSPLGQQELRAAAEEKRTLEERFAQYPFDPALQDNSFMPEVVDAVPYEAIVKTVTPMWMPSSDAAGSPSYHGALVSTRIPFCIWPAMLEWLQVVRWSTPPPPDERHKACFTISWVELAITMALHTGYDFNGLDIFNASAAIAAAVRTFNRVLAKGNRARFKVMPKVHSFWALTGQHFAGVDRRPVLPNAIWREVAQQILDAANNCASEGKFGVGIKIKQRPALRIDLARDPLIYIRTQVASLAVGSSAQPQPARVLTGSTRKALRSGPCAFGCANTHRTWHAPPRSWDASRLLSSASVAARWQSVSATDTLCDTHYQQACRLMRPGPNGRAPDQECQAAAVACVDRQSFKRAKLSAPPIPNEELAARDVARLARSSDGGAAGSGLTAEQRRLHDTDDAGKA